MEWLYRLIQEPNRLWYRYSQTIPLFMWLALQQLLTQYQLETSKGSFESFYPTRDASLDFLVVNSESCKIGEILVKQNLVSDDCLSLALKEQQKNYKKIGEILIEQGFISEPELKYHLKNQKIKLGELLVDNNVISPNQLNKLLARQKVNHKKLGEIIAQEKILSHEQIERFLLEQYWRHQGRWLAADKNKDGQIVESASYTKMLL
jgi:N-acetylglucosaminyldiphosphoundecaprenol N-acetyl-beta-D-mannosaminyltransferase